MKALAMILATGWLALVSGVVLAQGSAAQESRAMASQLRKQADAVVSSYAAAEDAAIKAAAGAVAERYRDMAAVRDKMADAIEAGDNDAATRLQDDWQKANRKAADQEQRLSALGYAANYASTREVEAWRTSTPASALDELSAFLGARTKATEAWLKVADMANRGMDPFAVDKLKDDAVMAGYEVTIAQRRWSSASDIANRLSQAAALNSRDLKEKIEEIRNVDLRAIDAIRKGAEADLALRRFDRSRQQLTAEAEKLREAASR